MKKKTNFQVTIGYRAIITFDVKAETQVEAEQLALKQMGDMGHFGKNSQIEDSNYSVAGCLDIDKSWNMVQS